MPASKGQKRDSAVHTIAARFTRGLDWAADIRRHRKRQHIVAGSFGVVALGVIMWAAISPSFTAVALAVLVPPAVTQLTLWVYRGSKEDYYDAHQEVRQAQPRLLTEEGGEWIEIKQHPLGAIIGQPESMGWLRATMLVALVAIDAAVLWFFSYARPVAIIVTAVVVGCVVYTRAMQQRSRRLAINCKTFELKFLPGAYSRRSWIVGKAKPEATQRKTSAVSVRRRGGSIGILPWYSTLLSKRRILGGDVYYISLVTMETTGELRSWKIFVPRNVAKLLDNEIVANAPRVRRE